MYVDEHGEISAVSSPFNFCAPRPLDELVTLEQEKNGEEEEGDDLLLVVPKALILQVMFPSIDQRTNMSFSRTAD